MTDQIAPCPVELDNNPVPRLATTDPDVTYLNKPKPDVTKPVTPRYSHTSLRQSGGSNPCRTSRAVNAWCFLSARVAWQMIHSVLRLLSSLVPPRLMGLMWSIWHSRSSSGLWQRVQDLLSLRQTMRRVSFQISDGCLWIIFPALTCRAATHGNPPRRALPRLIIMGFQGTIPSPD